MIFSAIVFDFPTSKIFGCFFKSSSDFMNGFFSISVVATSPEYASRIYKTKSSRSPPNFNGNLFASSKLNSRKCQGYPIPTTKSILPDINEPNGNWKNAKIITIRKIHPKYSPVLLEGINSFGIICFKWSVRDSPPA